MTSQPAALVVGAGIIGAAIAEALAADGWAVTVLESRFAGSGATGAAMGHVVVMDDTPAQLALTAESRRLWRERASRFGASAEVDGCGTLWLAATPEEAALLAPKAALYRGAGVEAEVLDGSAVAAAEPTLRAGLLGALRVPDDLVLYPPAVAQELISSAQRLGVRWRGCTEVLAVAPGKVVLAAEELEADVVVVAAGVDSARLLPHLPVVPRKGHLVITERYPRRLRHQLVEMGYLASAHGALDGASVAFNVQPRTTGQLLIGSTRELVGLDPRINRPLRSAMLRRAGEWLPQLGELAVLRSWVGFRPATPDHLPLIGPWDERLWVATGHEGLGVTTALATARLVADGLAGRRGFLDPAPFAPRREVLAHA